MNWPQLHWRIPSLWSRRPAGGALLGLAFDDGRLEAAEVRRTNGSADLKHTLSVPLALELLTAEPDLVGREIRKHLDAAGIRERHCAVCLPMSWCLTLSLSLPDLPEADLADFLQIEAERGFPSSVETLLVVTSRCRTPAGEQHATLIAVSRQHLARLETVLRAAQLLPVSFSLGITSLQPADGDQGEGVLALVPSSDGTNLQISCGGGIAVLRSLAASAESEGGDTGPVMDQLAREIRITLGQLPPDVRDAIRHVRVFGRGEPAEALTSGLRSRFEPLGLHIEQVNECAAQSFGVRLSGPATVSPALTLALRRLDRQAIPLEFLPPKVSRWKQFADKYASRKLAWSGAAAGVVVGVVALAFGIQQLQLLRWQARWDAMRQPVAELDALQQQIKQFRPWFDESFRSLTVLRRLSEAFPEDGGVTAKTIEIRATGAVTCTGTARDQKTLYQALDRLRAASEVRDVKVDQIRGRTPMQFTINFRWSGPATL
jgi:hypothetical protein